MTFLSNALLIVAVLMFFFNSRNVSEEYFIRRNVNNVFEKTFARTINEVDGSDQFVPLQPFSTISSSKTFLDFMTITIPQTVFTASETDSRLEFSKLNPPIGELSIRT